MTNRTTFTEAEVAFVGAQRVAHLATSDADGHPHVVPVCYAFDGERFYTPLDEKPKSVDSSKLRRVRNIEARHEASLLIDQYDDDWSRLGYVLVHGRADLISPQDPAHARALVLLRERYVQYRSMALETRQVIVITPDLVTSWGPAI
jgi:PPOX class probable F420-dependent enzyme